MDLPQRIIYGRWQIKSVTRSNVFQITIKCVLPSSEKFQGKTNRKWASAFRGSSRRRRRIYGWSFFFDSSNCSLGCALCSVQETLSAVNEKRASAWGSNKGMKFDIFLKFISWKSVCRAMPCHTFACINGAHFMEKSEIRATQFRPTTPAKFCARSEKERAPKFEHKYLGTDWAHKSYKYFSAFLRFKSSVLLHDIK